MQDMRYLKSLLKRVAPKSWLLEKVRDAYYSILKEIGYRTVRHRKQPFVFNGKQFRYFAHPHHWTACNERVVEIPLALHYLANYKGGRILEVGNVTGHYTSISHTVIDKFERADGVLNLDILDFTPTQKFDLILSISTFEHIGFNENNYSNHTRYCDHPENLLQAVEHAKQLLAPGGVFLLTVPLCYNPFLDQWISDGSLGMTDMWFLKRDSRWNWWKQVPYEEVEGVKYGARGWGAAGLMVSQYVNPGVSSITDENARPSQVQAKQQTPS